MRAASADSNARPLSVGPKAGATLALAVLFAFPAAGAAAGLQPIFHDGFEAGDPCGWTSATLPVVAEGELPSQRVDDELATAIPVSRCATVEGAIGSIVGGGADFDFYRIDAPEPFLLRWTLEPRTEVDDFVPYADLDDDDLLPIRGALPEVESGGSTRQVWIPEAGPWYVYVSDQRNWNRFFNVAVDPPVAENVDYRLRLSVERIIASSGGVFLDRDPRSITVDGAVSVHELIASCLQIDAQTWAERLSPPASPLDTRLLIIRPDGDSWLTIAESDDLPDSGLDSNLSEVDVAPGLHYVIVDFVDSYISPPALPAEFELDVSNGGACP